MIVVASANGMIGMEAAMDALKSGGSALDAVEVGTRLVEANANDHSVGYSGYPNLLGEVELDASIMNGDTLETGAVGSMTGYKYAISVARKVMENLPHVFLVGEGADRFAHEMGFKIEPLLSEEAGRVWKERLESDIPADVLPDLADQNNLWKWVQIATDPERTRGTVNFLAQDQAGNICGAVSTSGWAWKYPGRLGDSPVIGAGLYADKRFGAAACTGMGEMAIRACTAHSLVFYLKQGLSLPQAGEQTMLDLNDLGGRYLSRMNFVALDAQGNHAGFSNAEGQTYAVMTNDMSKPEEIARTYIHTRTNWGD
ncbi:MAG: N(4)-(beta-N-acetylglucosaminyl)-L-asparaginase [Chloroflexota bacterium]